MEEFLECGLLCKKEEERNKYTCLPFQNLHRRRMNQKAVKFVTHLPTRVGDKARKEITFLQVVIFYIVLYTCIWKQGDFFR